ncbi:MAG: hypothetical protein CMG65_02050 [Candidatus Marinimicrobia bacterium]|jgi:hypothetical protein|nr:hypothetical protein [Candidatus Neomarinimicrobiota bacterium]MBI66557.1 hypothetical protein [Candidatus Neomarinimicrobiota bacterium]|tara:strand:+ start:203 stop:553 length:351 start_codon:yes stop_codon:yes gene_type:complete
MIYNIIKILISAILIALISEVSKRSTFFGAVLASIPLVSVMAMIWLYIDTNDSLQVVQLSKGIFWLVIPSLVLFITFPFFIRLQFSFYTALSAAIFVMVVTYFITIAVLEKFDIHL